MQQGNVTAPASIAIAKQPCQDTTGTSKVFLTHVVGTAAFRYLPYQLIRRRSRWRQHIQTQGIFYYRFHLLYMLSRTFSILSYSSGFKLSIPHFTSSETPPADGRLTDCERQQRTNIVGLIFYRHTALVQRQRTKRYGELRHLDLIWYAFNALKRTPASS